MPELRDDLDILIEAVAKAGDIALRHFRAKPKVWDKPGGAGPVTEADLAVDDYLREHLLAQRPGTAWLSEETEDTADRLGSDALFVLDPIDGTRAYIDGSEDWALSLALVSRGQPIAAVVHMPAKERTYAAALGAGATLNTRPITCSDAAEMASATVLTAKPTLSPAHWKAGAPPFKRHFRSSLAYRLCLVAEGRFDAMMTLRDTWHWDIAAGALIATEAGARVTDRNAATLGFNTPTPQSPGTIAAPPKLHSAIAKALA